MIATYIKYFPFFFIFFSVTVFSQTIEEIVVKGDWREKNALEEDSSVVVLNNQIIESQPIKHFENLSYLVPNLNFAASDSRARHFQIRGIGERSGYERTPNSAVGFLIDDIDYSGQGGIATTFDVDQIEVHRGPQGSRIGSNALAGLIYIRTKEPTEVFEGTSEVTLGSYGTRNAGIAFGGPTQFNDDISYRLALRQDYSDGFRKNLYSGKSNTSKKDEDTYRLKINWKLRDKTRLKFMITQIDLDDPADIWTIDGSLNTLSDRPGMDSQKTNAYGIKIFHQFDGFEFQSYTSVTNTDVVLSYDADWGNSDSHMPYIYDYFSETLRNRDTFSQELRFVSDSADFSSQNMTEWVVGHTLRYHLGMDQHINNPQKIWINNCPPLAKDRNITILGLGALGAASARSLSQIGFKVSGWSNSSKDIENVTTYHKKSDLKKVLNSAQILILLLPDTPKTQNIINTQTLAYLPEGSFLINPGRGSLIDDDALITALLSGQVAGACLDVFRTEPLPKDHPLRRLNNVTLSPHIAGASIKTVYYAAEVIAEDLKNYLENKELINKIC